MFQRILKKTISSEFPAVKMDDQSANATCSRNNHENHRILSVCPLFLMLHDVTPISIAFFKTIRLT